MAPIKFENDLKDRLESRRIEPSAASWNQLANRLDESQATGKRNYWWLAIAASVVIGVFAIYQWTEDSIEVDGETNFVKEEPAIDPTEKNNNEVNQEMFKAVTPLEAVAVEQTIDVSASSKNAVQKKPASTVAKLDIAQVLDGKYTDKDIVEDALNSEAIVVEAEIDKMQLEQFLDEARATKKNNIDKEADSLLKAAQKALLFEKTLSTESYVVDADLLLLEVEEEVEPSLRSKVYHTIKDGFKKVKTAVAQRNNK